VVLGDWCGVCRVRSLIVDMVGEVVVGVWGVVCLVVLLVGCGGGGGVRGVIVESEGAGLLG
jgi:hypothetical protein